MLLLLATCVIFTGGVLQMTTKQGLERIMKTLQDLLLKVEELKTVELSAIALIKGLAQKLKDAQSDPAKIQAIIDELDNNEKELANAVVSNTPSEPVGPFTAENLTEGNVATSKKGK